MQVYYILINYTSFLYLGFLAKIKGLEALVLLEIVSVLQINGLLFSALIGTCALCHD